MNEVNFIGIFRSIKKKKKKIMSAEGDVNPKAYPLADAKLTKDILELVHQAQNYVKHFIPINSFLFNILFLATIT